MHAISRSIGSRARAISARRVLVRLGPGAILLTALGALALGKGVIALDNLRGFAGPDALPELSDPAQGHPLPTPADAALLAEPAAGPDGGGAGGGDAGPEAGASAGRPADISAAITLDPASLDPAELEALSELVARRAALEERERELELRAALIEDAEAKLAARLSELEALKAAIEAMLQEHDAAEEAKLTSLVKIYESMKPKAAAEIFNRLDMPVLLGVVSRMREGVASEIIGRMNPERAEVLTAELARRRGLPDTAAGAHGGGA